MKLIIFGATGSLGRHLVDRALDQGHDVTAFSRDPSALAREHPRLAHFAGDALDPDAVHEAVAGHDAVLFALGAGRKGTVRAEGVRNAIDAMGRHGVRRLVCATTLGVGDSRANLNFFWKRIMFGLLLRQAFADHEAQEAFIRQSEVDWIIVRPGAYTDGPATGEYRVGFSKTARKLALKVSRADVAEFMLRQLTSDAYLRQAPGLSY